MKKMKGAMLPKESYEKKQSMNAVGREKYGTDFGNPEALTKSTEKLVSFVKKNKMNY